MRKGLLRGVLAVASLAIVLTAVGLGYRVWRQHENAIALAIDAPRGIAESEYVKLGGIEQWIQIRGQDRRNPIILFMHGGPGASESAVSSLLQPWEKYFTVVMWDQRCAGKTFARDGVASCKGMTIENVAADGNALAELLRRKLHQKKIIALGHSWGTMIGVRMVKERPDLYSAFVGTGFVVSILEKEPILYADTMKRLRLAHAQDGIAALKKIGPPPYKSPKDIEVQRDWSERYDIPSERDLFSDLTPVAAFAPGWSLWDLYAMTHSAAHAEAETFDADADYDARRLGLHFTVPVIIINGAVDRVTPTFLAKSYFDRIDAPYKYFAVIPNAGHSAVLTEPGAFLQVLLKRVRPIAIQYENGVSHG
ncbi:MAG TPA: alpha/beta hydrolase [Rhizomicrobium sp.]|nr:alpha/beta hydrolase [Rhizomicrobium sp.]